MTETVASPCINVCALDEHDICMGCFRTCQEITDWTSYDNARKREVVKAAGERLRRHFNPV